VPSPYRIAADVVFVAIMVSTVFLCRLGSRGMAIGTASYIAYFFAGVTAALADAPRSLRLTHADDDGWAGGLR
jgi:hypothetical protein